MQHWNDWFQANLYITQDYLKPMQNVLLGIVNEALVFSNKNEIEILPALFESGFDAGEITGIKARTRATVDSLRWDLQSKTAQVTVTSDIDQTITVSCGLSDKTETLTFRAGETKTVDFALN